MTVRTRFAPSPTGFLHIGGVRTALFNWLLARHSGGQFVLRIDDTDQQRHVADAVRLILDGFRWMGMDWDEGPDRGGPHAPYFQSQRGEKYKAAADRLIASGQVYRDYSTEADRAAAKLAAEKAKVAFRYRGVRPSAEEIARFDFEGRAFALRFQVPLGRKLILQDVIKGPVEQRTDEIGDFVIVRPDGSPLYNFATVVDDADMEITHVVRAEEHLANTFPQLLVFEALGYPLPQFAHVPYVAAKGSKKKLSKRDGAVGLEEFINEGYLNGAMMNYLARVGWSFDASTEIFSRADLIEKFTLDKVNSAPASHDSDKLFWIQGEWMRKVAMPEKVEHCWPYVENAEAWFAWNARRTQEDYRSEGVLPFLETKSLVPDAIRPKLEAVITALGDRLKTYSDIIRLGGYFFSEEISHDPDAVKKRLKKDGVPAMLAELREILGTLQPYDMVTLEKTVHDFGESQGIKMGDVVNPLRVAVTGQGVGPGLYDCLFILGRETCVRRIDQTLTLLRNTGA